MISVSGSGDTPIRIRTSGEPEKPAILLIHGYSQHSLCWKPVFDRLSDDFFLVAPDLRGHGESGKPLDKSAYDNARVWAEDVAAIIDQMNLKNPILVGWSMGGWVAQDYLRHFGGDALQGLVLIGTSLTTGKLMPPEAIAARQGREDVAARGMYSVDQAENLHATLKFVRACTQHPVADDAFALTVGFNMLCPPHARHACRTRSEDYRSTTVAYEGPVWLVWGEADQMATPPMRQQAIDCLPAAQTTIYPDCGHTPFVEYPDLFARNLAEFAGARGRPDAAAIPDPQSVRPAG
ncbi:MAG: alpha/beta hydrolase [Pseudomonadota bacterium]